MRSIHHLPATAAGVLGATALATFYMDDGWLLWIPVVLALIVANSVTAKLGR